MSTIRRRTLGLLAGGAVLAAIAVGPALAQEARNYILSTATTGGTYYPVGVALATLVKVKLEPSEGIGMSAISSAGSGENIKLLRENQAQFAIVQGIFGLDAWNGAGDLVPEGKQENLRSATMLWQNVEHFLVHNDMVKDGTMADLTTFDGAPFSIGARNRTAP
jgi:TRAP transporter TAXI family solute receptor